MAPSSSSNHFLGGNLPCYQPARVASLLRTYLEEIDFIPTGNSPVNEALETYMEDLMYARGLECKQLKRTIHLSASLIELGCHGCTFEEKKNAALFNWFCIYADDQVTRDPIPFQEFGSRLLRRQQQLDPVLTNFTEVLERMWDLYDPLAASVMFNHTLGFITGCCIEPELETLPLKQGVDRFSWYIRDLTGIAIAFSLFPFTKKGKFNMLQVIQALPDMNFWVCATNDLLSFHKEEEAGETGTYIYNRARNDNKSRYETCAELIAELKKARNAIYTALADNPAALKIWRTWECGYIEWHIVQDRYHLKDLGIQI